MKNVKPRKPHQLKLRQNVRIQAFLDYDYSDDDGARSEKVSCVYFDIGSISLTGAEARRIAAWLAKEYAPWADGREKKP